MWFWLFLQKKRNISNDYYYYYYYYNIIIIITYFLISHSDDYCFSLNASFNVLLHCINFSWIEFVPHFFQIDYLILLALNVELSIIKVIKTLIIIAVIYTTEAVVKLNHVFISFSAVQTYDLPAYLYSFAFFTIYVSSSYLAWSQRSWVRIPSRPDVFFRL